MTDAFFSFVAVACVIALFADTPATRCALGIAALHIVANASGLMTTNWMLLFLLNLAAMVSVVWRPAGWLQALMGGLFLAGAVKHLAFGLSGQTATAEFVSWELGTGLALVQAAILLLYSGGCIVGRTRLWGTLRRGRLVRYAPRADSR